MNSILKTRPSLAGQITEVAEVAGYLWKKGWAERNGGNITINITAGIDGEVTSMKAISEAIPIGRTLPFLKGCWFFCKGANKRMRDLALRPMENGSIVRITEDCCHYEIVADLPVKPTSEIISHLSIHNYLIGRGSSCKAVLHTHPIDLIAMTHNPAFLQKDVLTYLLWSMIPETRAFCPRGLGIIPYTLPGSAELADATIKELEEYEVVMWEKHGVISVSENIMEAFDMVDTLSKSAQIYLTAKGMGFEPEGMSREQMDELKTAFNLPK
jgi:rhamnulose-1-phosphate aldolase